MSHRIDPQAIHPELLSHLHPFLQMEYEVQHQCHHKKKRLKLELIEASKTAASQKVYSPIEAKPAANALINEKLENAIEHMKSGTSDTTKQELIDKTWHVLSGELFSPLEFKGVLEKILRGERHTSDDKSHPQTTNT